MSSLKTLYRNIVVLTAKNCILHRWTVCMYMCAWKTIPSNGLGVEVEVEGVGVVMGIVTSAAIKQKSHDVT